MCTGRRTLMCSIIDASVVDLPEPVGPVTSTNPCLKSHAAASIVRDADLARRRDRERDGAHRHRELAAAEEAVRAEAVRVGVREREVEVALVVQLREQLLGEQTARSSRRTFAARSTGAPLIGTSRPSTRTRAGEPGVIRRSVPPRRMTSFR